MTHGRRRSRWDGNIKMDIKERMLEYGADLFDSAHDMDQKRSLLNKLMNLRVH
jgi:hypothetical protein